MSGIYIKGMEMPTSCSNCELAKHFDGYQDNDCPFNAFSYHDCPLVEVPDHGDLIDRDVLKEKCWDADTRSGHVQAVDVGDIDDAPTIIPADKEEGET